MKAWRDLAKLPRALWILCLATLVNRMGTMALPFLILYLTRDLGFSVERAGACLAVYGAVALWVGPYSGRLADRWGALRTMEISLLTSGVVLVLFPLARSWPAVLAMTMLFSATNEAFRPANMALIGELGAGPHRKSAFALARMAINLGMSVGPALGGFLARVSFPALFAIDGITTLAALLILQWGKRKGVFPIPLTLSRPDAPPESRPKRGLLEAFFRDPVFRVFLLGVVPVAIVFFQHTSTMPLFLVRDLGYSEAVYGMLFTLNTLMIIAIEIPLNSATAHWPHSRSLPLGSVLFGVGFGALAYARSIPAVAATVVIWTFGEMILFPALSAFVSEIAPEGRKGEYMGLYSMAFSVAFIIGPWAGTLALDRWGAKPLWIGVFGVSLFSAWLLGSGKKADNAMSYPCS